MKNSVCVSFVKLIRLITVISKRRKWRICRWNGRTTHFDSRLDVLTVLAIFRPYCSVSLYEWRLCYPWLAMAIVKVVVGICRTREGKPIERYKARTKISEDHKYIFLSEVFWLTFLATMTRPRNLVLFDLKLYRLTKRKIMPYQLNSSWKMKQIQRTMMMS